MNRIGIIQGRLSPPNPQRLQAFPWSSWEQEFAYAGELGLDFIEWLFEVDGYEHNPIWTDAGARRIRDMVKTHGVGVHSVCADYFMPRPFFRVMDEERVESITTLNRLIRQTDAIGARTILVPVLEISEVRTEGEAELLIDALQQCMPVAHEHGVRLGLETELPAGQYRGLVSDVGDDQVGVYYDTGNASAMGYDTAADVRLMGPLLCGIHVKDRVLGGGSVYLGEGAAGFPACFAALREVGYTGPVTLQPFFGGDFLGDAKRNVEFVRNHMSTACGGPR